MMIKKIVNLIFEAQMLKSKKREGWRLAGVERPESVADHVCCAAQLGYIIAKMEGADAHKVAAMLVRHDIGETRIGDIDKLGARYFLNKNEDERRAVNEQCENLECGDDILSLISEYKNRDSLEGKIAKDADYLECAFQARKYEQIGHTSCSNRVTNVGGALRTESAKKIWKEMSESHFSERWKGMKNIKE